MKIVAFPRNLLLVAMALGTAWAVRGQFGHEHGAAWAGGIGVLAVLVLSRRQDWYRRLPAIVAIGAIGWGVGGMMSYGRVVGYGRGLDFLNVSYGLFSLMLIGGLYGFIGGGLTGLSLASSETKRVDWASLLTQMVAGAYLIWGILIYQLEWLMTPPRSELWAACLGAALALGWYAYRHGYHPSLRVAFSSALGAGFGFAFGNFLQVIGDSTEIVFNWWNVMEYSLGFFGGLGMAYGVFSEEWPDSVPPDRAANLLGWFFLMLLLPIINITEALGYEKIIGRAEELGIADLSSFVNVQYVLSRGSWVIIATLLTWYYREKITGKKQWSDRDGLLLWTVYLAWYIALSNLLGAIWRQGGGLKEYLYWLNLLLVAIGIYQGFSYTMQKPVRRLSPELWLRVGIIVVLLVFVLSFVLINTHDAMPGAHSRFSTLSIN